VEERLPRVHYLQFKGIIMGDKTFTRSLYKASKTSRSVGTSDVTRAAAQKAISTGKLDQLVDPSGFGVTRLSLPRVEEQKDGLFKMLVGCPMPVETRVDTTGSMGGNVDVAMRVLPDAFESWTQVLEGYDIHCATGIFGDVSDNFPLCRPQFEMQADKIVHQLTLMVPEKDGGDTPEDPDIGIFGGAYLCRHYANRLGLKGYDFTVTDAPGRGRVDEKQLIRVFGEEVFEKIEQNEHRLQRQGIYNLADIWSALLDRAHAFVLQVGRSPGTTAFWKEHIGKERLVRLPDTEFLPYVQAVIIGLTEGTLLLNDAADFLQQFNLSKVHIDSIVESVVDIPIAAQSQLANYGRRPMKGDLFDGKPDVWKDEHLWPVKKAEEVAADEPVSEKSEEDGWL
jgi:hypothetical protein